MEGKLVLAEVAKYVSVFMSVPVLAITGIVLNIDSYKIKKTLVVIQFILIAIQIGALTYSFVV
jgi:hypothetical protein